MVERVLMDLCDEDCAFNADTLTFWEWWVRQKENKQDPKEGDKPPEKKSKTAPIIFKEPMVGTHVVFVIDVSDSMKWPIKDEDIEKIKRDISAGRATRDDFEFENGKPVKRKLRFYIDMKGMKEEGVADGDDAKAIDGEAAAATRSSAENDKATSG